MRVAQVARFGAVAVGAVAFSCLPVTSGCAQTPSSVQVTPDEDLFGESLPPLDVHKAYRSLEETEPVVNAPVGVKREQPALSERAQRSLARSLKLRLARRYTEATMELEKALRYEPASSVIHRSLALTLWEAGNTQRARAHITQALADGEDDIVSHYLLGRLAARRFENAEAIGALKTALLCSSDNSTSSFRVLAQYHLAELLVAEGYLSAAVELYEQFQTNAPAVDPQAHPNPELAELLRVTSGGVDEHIARAYEHLRRYDKAAAHLRAAYAGQEMNAETRLAYAKTLARAGDYAAALREACLALSADRAAVEVLARIHQRQGKPEAIIDDLRQASADQPENVQLTLALVDALRRFDRSDEAIRLLRERVSVQDERGDLRWALFDVLGEQKRWADAFGVAAGAIRRKAEWTPDAAEKIRSLATGEEGRAALLDSGEGARCGEGDCAEAYLCGIAAQTAGLLDRAVASFQTAIAAEPTFVPARADLAKIHLRRYAWRAAIETAAPDDVTLKPDTRLEQALAEAYSGLDNFEEAVTHYNNAIRLNRTNTAAMLALAELYSSREESNRTMRQLEALVKADPLHERARELLFRAYLADDDHRAAAEQVAQLRRMSATPTCVARCMAWLEFNPAAPDHERLRSLLQEAMDGFHPDAETLNFIALSYLAERRPDEAAHALEQALALEPDNHTTIGLLVTCHRARLEFEQALALQRAQVNRYPHRRALKNDIVDLLTILQDYAECVEMASALLAEPGLDEQETYAYRTALVRSHIMADDYRSAIEVLEHWWAQEQGNAFAFFWLIRTCQQAERTDRAMELIRQWPEKIPGAFSVGDENIWEGLAPRQQEEAVQLVLQAIENDPDSDRLQIRLIELLRAIGRFDESLELARNNVSVGRERDDFQFEMYLTYEAAGRLDDAIALIDHMIVASAPVDFPGRSVRPDLHQALAQLLVRAERYPRALEKLYRWFKQADSNEEKLLYLNLLAGAQQEGGELEDAAETLESALQLDPTNVGLSNDLGYIWADAGRNLARAEELTRFAVAGSPTNSAYLDSLGWVLYKKGDFAGAQKWLYRARYAGLWSGYMLLIDREDPVICDHLADTCWRLGQRDQAGKWWNESVRFATQRLNQPSPGRTDAQVLESVSAKLEALEAGQEPNIAPTAAGKDDRRKVGAEPVDSHTRIR